MEYMDEKMLEIRNQKRQAEKDQEGLEGKVNIGGRLYEFEDAVFFDGKMAMKLPREFTDMPKDLAKLKYPAEQRPQIIKSNQDGSINITVSIYPQKLKQEEILECISGIKAVIERMNPANIFFDLKVEENEALTVGYFDFKSNAIDSDLYNIMFVTPIAGNAMLGTFNCRLSEREDWKEVVLQMIMSIKDLTKPNRGGQPNAGSRN
jgi:hypothetical protein